MTRRRIERLQHLIRALEPYGVTPEEIEILLRAERTLRRWAEGECGYANGGIERDEKTGIPYYRNITGARYRIRDRETGAIRRVDELVKRRGLTWYYQGDPRGAAVYIIRPGDIPEGADVRAYYSRGVCVSID